MSWSCIKSGVNAGDNMWFRKIFLVVVWGPDCMEVVRITKEDMGKPVETTAKVQAIQIVVWTIFVRVERKRKWMDAVNTVKMESRKLADD